MTGRLLCGGPWHGRPTVVTRVGVHVAAPPHVTGAVYGDWAGWPQLFSTTIRGVRELAAIPRCVALEIDHVDGRVPNVLVRRSPVEYELWEDKRRYTARFRSTFAAAGDGTDYRVEAWVSVKGVGRLLRPVAGLVVRARLRRLVLEPVRRAAERRWTAERGDRGDANAASPRAAHPVPASAAARPLRRRV